MLEKCTICGKTFTDVFVKAIVELDPYRKREDGTTERIQNNCACYSEIICPECFEKLVNIIDENFNKG